MTAVAVHNARQAHEVSEKAQGTGAQDTARAAWRRWWSRKPQTQRPFPRVRTPTVLQMESVECGAASLAIILGYHGRFVPLEVLRLECGVSRDGSKAGNVVRVARTYGLQAKGFKMELGAVRAVRPPVIVFWNFNHFLVVEGFKRDRVYLNDPSSGPRTVTMEEFDESFTGVVLTFEPGPEFVRGGERPSLVASLGRRLAGSRLALTYVVLVGLALVGPGLVVPTFGRVFVDDILVGGANTWVQPLLLAMLLCAALRGALTWLQKRYLGRFETKLALATTSQFLWHVLRLPIEFFTQRYAGDISRRVTLNDQIARLLSGELATHALNLVVVVFYASLMLLYDRVLCGIGVAVALINLLLLRLVARRRIDQNLALQQDLGKLHGTGIGGLQTIETLKATGGEGDFFARWAGFQAKVVSAQQRLGAATVLLNAAPPLLSTFNTIAILGLGALRVMDGHMSMGLLVAFQSLVVSFLQPVNELVRLGGTLQETQSDMARLDDVLRYQTDPACPAELTETTRALPEAARLRGEIELRDVSFGYSRLEAPLIEHLDLVLKPGRRVALVGGSGSGKSTIAKLVTGLYRPWQGEILLDGVPREQLPHAVLTQSLAGVDQDIFLFEGTVADNLTLWDPSIPEHDVIEAARDAMIHDDITGRPGGYNHRVEEGGRNFSGGQRQRLELARALVGRPSILVLDEATSALDPHTEMLIDTHLRRRGCTCLIVAHRLSTIRDCDEILVLERGRVVERGTHEALLQTGGAYSRLISTV